MKKAVIYSRVSTDMQNWKTQVRDLKYYARHKKYKVVESFGETVSGYDTSKERLEYEKMKSFVVQGKVDIILCWEISRFSRNTRMALAEIEYFKKQGIGIYFKKENINTLDDDPNTKLMLTILSGFSEMERETIVQRSKRGLENRAKDGKRVGLPNMPFGITSDKDGYLIEKKEESKYVRKMFKWYIQGWSFDKIAKELSGKVPTKQGKPKWRGTSVRRIITNELYNGKRPYKDLDLRLPFKIIDDELWQKAQIRNEERHHFYSRERRTDTTSYETHKFKGKVVCGHCGTPWGSNSELSGENVLYHYRCGGMSKGTCDAGQFKAGSFDSHLILMMVGTQSFVEGIFRKRLEEFDSEENRRQLANVENGLRRIKERVRIIKDMRAEDLDEVGYSRRMVQVRQDESELKNKKSDLEQEWNRYYRDRESEEELSYSITYGEQNQIEKLVEKVVVYKVEKYKFDWADIPKTTYFVDTDENGIAEVTELDFGPNVSQFKGGSDKMLYVELYLFDVPTPVKGMITSMSLSRYVGDNIEYDELTRTAQFTQTA